MRKALTIPVLIVDDQFPIRSLVRNGLQLIGFSDIREACDGEDALRLLQARPATLVVSDYSMPKLDGIGLLRWMRVHGPTRDSAFIMLSGCADLEVLQGAKEAGVNGFLAKPFTLTSLKQRIEGIFGKLS